MLVKKLLVLLVISGICFAQGPAENEALKKGEWGPIDHMPLESVKSLAELEQERSVLKSEIVSLNKQIDAARHVKTRSQRISRVAPKDSAQELIQKRADAERALAEVDKLIAEKNK